MNRIPSSLLAVVLLAAACGPSEQQLAYQREAAAMIDRQIDAVNSALDAGDLAGAERALGAMEAQEATEAILNQVVGDLAAAREAVAERRTAEEGFARAQASLDAGEYLEARRAFEQVADAYPFLAAQASQRSDEATDALIEQKTTLIADALESGDVEQALAQFRAANEVIPESPEWTLLADRVAEAFVASRVEAIEAAIREPDPTRARQLTLRTIYDLGRSTDGLNDLLDAAERMIEVAEEARRAQQEQERVAAERFRRDVSQRIGCEGGNPVNFTHCQDFRAAPISRADLGDRWPLTVAGGAIICSSQGTRQIATFLPNGSNREYGLNGTADSLGWPSIRPIWADDNRPGFRGQGIKVNIRPLITEALTLC